jgi:hypothetical protein
MEGVLTRLAPAIVGAGMGILVMAAFCCHMLLDYGYHYEDRKNPFMPWSWGSYCLGWLLIIAGSYMQGCQKQAVSCCVSVTSVWMFTMLIVSMFFLSRPVR